ncbi:MAG: hypothetical protein AAF383_07220 [Cyanobacteria bacterium P01_A01_bin.83]
MNINSVNDESIFHPAISAVEALSLAEQAVLIDIIPNRKFEMISIRRTIGDRLNRFY